MTGLKEFLTHKITVSEINSEQLETDLAKLSNGAVNRLVDAIEGIITLQPELINGIENHIVDHLFVGGFLLGIVVGYNSAITTAKLSDVIKTLKQFRQEVKNDGNEANE